MNTGFLFWFDATPKRSLQEKIAEAALYYRRMFDQQPTLCLVNPDELVSDSKDETQALLSVEVPNEIKITVRPWKSVLRNHLWIGTDDQPEYTRENVGMNARQVRESVQ